MFERPLLPILLLKFSCCVFISWNRGSLIFVIQSIFALLVTDEKINLLSALYQSISRFFQVCASFPSLSFAPNSFSVISIRIKRSELTFLVQMVMDDIVYPKTFADCHRVTLVNNCFPSQLLLISFQTTFIWCETLHYLYYWTVSLFRSANFYVLFAWKSAQGGKCITQSLPKLFRYLS